MAWVTDVEAALHDRIRGAVDGRTAVYRYRHDLTTAKGKFVVVGAAALTVELITSGPRFDQTAEIPVRVGTARAYSTPDRARAAAFGLAKLVADAVLEARSNRLVDTQWRLVVSKVETVEAWDDADQRVILDLTVEAKGNTREMV